MTMLEAPLPDDLTAEILGSVVLSSAQLTALQQSLMLFDHGVRENVAWGIVKQLGDSPSNAELQAAIVNFYAGFGVTTPVFIS